MSASGSLHSVDRAFRIRRDVQGGNQDAAPVATATQEARDTEGSGAMPWRHCARPLPWEWMEGVSQQEDKALQSHLHRRIVGLLAWLAMPAWQSWSGHSCDRKRPERHFFIDR